MNYHYLIICLLSILASFAEKTAARNAIIGGDVAEPKPFRYMVSLLEVNYGHICGGAVLTDHHVLSAAHCFIQSDNTLKPTRVAALAGTNDLLKFDHPAVDVEVVKIYVPAEYNAADVNTTGDIAILKLKDAFHILNHRNIKQIKLEKNRNELHGGQTAIISGWGWNKIVQKNNQDTGIRTDPLLRFAEVDVLNNVQCQAEHPFLKITHEHLCAKVKPREQEMRGVCHGDDGSPLVHDGTVIGVLSKFPYKCSEETQSAIYTRVSHYLTFIGNVKINLITRHIRSYTLRQ